MVSEDTVYLRYQPTMSPLVSRWVKLVHQGEERVLRMAKFPLPEKNDTIGILSAVCRGLPKVRQAQRLPWTDRLMIRVSAGCHEPMVVCS